MRRACIDPVVGSFHYGSLQMALEKDMFSN